MTPDKAPSTPISVNSLIFSQSTLTPTTRATFALSPMKSRCSPKRCRFKTNHISTASAMAQKNWTGTGPSRPVSTSKMTYSLMSRMLWLNPPEEMTVAPSQTKSVAKGRDDRGNADPHHEEAVEEADQAADEKRQDEGAPHQQVVLVGHVLVEREDAELGDHHEDQAGDLEHGGEGEVDLAGGDDQREAEAENERGHDRAAQRRVHAITEEALGCRDHEGADHDEKREDDRQAFDPRPQRLMGLELRPRHAGVRSATRSGRRSARRPSSPPAEPR